MPVFNDVEGIHTIQLGAGDVFIACVEPAEGDDYTGVCFHLGQAGTIGREDPSTLGKTCKEVGVILKITSTKKESFDVLIEALLLAKNALAAQEGSAEPDPDGELETEIFEQGDPR